MNTPFFDEVAQELEEGAHADAEERDVHAPEDAADAEERDVPVPEDAAEAHAADHEVTAAPGEIETDADDGSALDASLTAMQDLERIAAAEHAISQHDLHAAALSQASNLGGGVSVAPPKMDAIVCLTADINQSPECNNCGREVDVFKGQIKSKSSALENAKWICRSCNCISTNMSRNLTWPPRDFVALPKNEQMEFFRNCQDACQEDGRFKYGKLRACLVTSMTNVKIKETKASVEGSYLPLSWYKQKGCTDEELKDIEATCDMDIHPTFGPTYRCNIKTISTSVLVRQVEETVARCERQLKAKTAEELEAGGASNRAAALTNFASEEDKPAQPVLALTNGPPGTPAPTEPEPPEETQAEKARKAKAEAKAKAQAARKEKSLLEKHNNTQTQLATKSLAGLAQLVTKTKSLIANAHFGLLPEIKRVAIEEQLTQLQAKEKECKTILSKQAAAAAKGVKLDALSFSNKDITDKAKDVQTMLKDAEQIMKLLSK